MQFLLVALLSFVCLGCVSAKQDQRVSAIQSQLISNDQHTIHYASSGDINKHGVLFIHGTPGRWSAFEDYLNNTELQNEFYLVSLDRLNWGLSSQQKEFGFDEQANAISLVMQHYDSKKWIIVGHSLGASIAPKVALNNHNSVKGLLLLAGTLQPELGKPRWYNRLAKQSYFKWLVPKELEAANEEIIALQTELLIMNEQIDSSNLNLDLVVIQGMKDKLVSPKNARFVNENWKDKVNNLNVIELEEEGHFLPWRQTDLVIEQIKILSSSDIYR